MLRTLAMEAYIKIANQLSGLCKRVNPKTLKIKAIGIDDTNV